MSKQAKWITIVVSAFLLLACICLCCAAVAFIAYNRSSTRVQSEMPIQEPTLYAPLEITTETPQRTETPGNSQTDPTSPTAPAQPQPATPDSAQNLANLEQITVPISDPRDLAMRLQGKTDIPETEPAPKQPFQVGAVQQFWATNDDSHKHFQFKATLRYITPHVYFWTDNGVNYNQADIVKLSDTFEKKIYPTDREFFGSEWTPGIDNDPHIYVVYAGKLGSNVGGYFSSADEVSYQARADSNAHEMFFINADGVDLSGEFVYSTMAHEFQHMIHYYRDRNESTWMNEGFSMLAQQLNGYGPDGLDATYIQNPDLQLTAWDALPSAAPHYGESFLFLSYFLDRVGEKATQAVAGDPLNGMESIDDVMKKMNITDPKTGKVISADDLFADWAVTSYLNDTKAGDGRFAYKSYATAPQASATETVKNCPSDWASRTVHQYGIDYIAIPCTGKFNLEFQGSTQVNLLPVAPASGSYAFWSNQGDESDMTLTHEFDFSQVKGAITLSYKTWYDLEKDYDFVYLLASQDGQHWEMVKTPHGTDNNLSGDNYGIGYNGASKNWVNEQVDLSKYAGKKIQLRFEYITDPAVNGAGFLMDDIRIPEVNYATDLEKDDGGWKSNGFARISSSLPQTYRVSLITRGTETSVQYLTLDQMQKASASMNIQSEGGDAVLVVSGTTPFTTHETAYRFRVTR